MAVKLKGSYTVKPAEPTWEGRQPLSELDQVGCITHIPTISFYRRPQNSQLQPETLINTARESLSRVLVTFYPLAGRLRWITKGRLELDCNAMGARVIEAETESKISEFIGELPEYHHLIPKIDYTLPIHELPIVLVQLTRFSCGGVSISLCISHAVVDGQSLLHFIFEWAAQTRGEPLMFPPFLDRKALRAGIPAAIASHSLEKPSFNLPSLITEQEEVKEKEKEASLAILRLSKDQVEKLKRIANQGLENNTDTKNRAYTRFETLAGYVWRCACKARGHKPEQQTALGVCVDTRRRMTPPLPWGYFGNAIIDVLATSAAGELTSNPLGYAAGRIQEAVEMANGVYVWGAIEYLKCHEDLRDFQDLGARLSGERFPFYKNPNLGVVSWLSLPMYGVDFGWGKEAYIGPGDVDGETAFLVPCPSGDGSVVVALCLQADHMESFKKHFYNDVV
ncbi:Hydroxycinnamoyl-Coenzyme A shikimate/quinate hydroxycinnamoyltransferase [Morus notabilis]|uniref:Hydroxycinnamoyl-Coenzyme A shikimate/quinate hydroxycinnamoyltransferase n=1 Tax=Morus notabilis TaxID=981085 RepID=W9S626_9ROSA|nr:spermidine hydroxycinnamoyl transferase [Morus notabilis]EXC27890.1 Hydroxycinnamoyl-Coenzyme A shikimate/quinate hydroxycinnamoyltransferase [Morus notabilis]